MARLGCMLLALSLCLACGSSPPKADEPPPKPPEVVPPSAGETRVLVFSRTEGYRHASIPAGLEALKQLATEGGYGLDATEEATAFNDETLSAFAAVVFLNTTGDVLNEEQQAAFERYIASGKGYVGVHSASDCEYDWPFYGELVGAYFTGHSLITTATLQKEPVTHAALADVPSMWSREDEWYGFRTNPRENATILLTIDESSYDPGEGRMGADHPVAWYHQYGGGRAFYTALGHTRETYTETTFLSHLRGGLEWAAAVTPP